jgi:hypothetical protein
MKGAVLHHVIELNKILIKTFYQIKLFNAVPNIVTLIIKIYIPRCI